MDEIFPLVSCLMVTRAANMKIIDGALYSYINQTYKNKELIIVPDCDVKNLDNLKRHLDNYKDENIKLVELKEKLMLGSLRNVSIDNASGEYCIQWDDDDLYHERRIEMQYQEIISGDYDYCLLKNFMMYFYNTYLLSINRWYDDKLGGQPPSILFKKDINFRYPKIPLHEDIAIVERTDLKRCILDDKPYLYIYTYHGNNCYDYQHYLSLYSATKMTFDIEILDQITPLLDYICLNYRF